MTLDHVMTRRIVAANMDDTLAHIRDLFERHAFHHLLILEAGRPVGIISDRDLLKNLSPFLGKLSERSQDAFLLQRKAHQIMRRSLISAGPQTPVKDAVILMLANRVHCLPVIDADGHCVGIATSHDIMRYLLECGLEPSCSITKAA